VSANPVVTETLLALGLGDSVVGIDLTSAGIPGAEAVDQVGYHRALNAEQILALNPELVLISDEAGPAAVLKQLKDAGVSVVTIPVFQELDSLMVTVQAVATSVGGVSTDPVKKQMASHQAELEALPAPQGVPSTIALYARGGIDKLHLLGLGTPIAGIIQSAGGNMSLSFDGAKSITPEAVLEADPECIVVPNGTLESAGLEALLNHPILGQTRAAKARNIISLQDHVFFGVGPSAYSEAVKLKSYYLQTAVAAS